MRCPPPRRTIIVGEASVGGPTARPGPAVLYRSASSLPFRVRGFARASEGRCVETRREGPIQGDDLPFSPCCDVGIVQVSALLSLAVGEARREAGSCRIRRSTEEVKRHHGERPLQGIGPRSQPVGNHVLPSASSGSHLVALPRLTGKTGDVASGSGAVASGSRSWAPQVPACATRGCRRRRVGT